MARSLIVDTFYKTSPAPAGSVSTPVDLGGVLELLKGNRDAAVARLAMYKECMQHLLQEAKEAGEDIERTQKRLDELNTAIAILGAAAGSTD